MFCEYDFLEYCEDRYLHLYCNQEEAVVLQDSGGLAEAVRNAGTWQLTVWLGEYITTNAVHAFTRKTTNDKR